MDEPRFVNVDDYEPAARERLPKDVYDYFAGGAGDEWSLAENRRAFDRWVLRPRFLRGAGAPDTSAESLGTPLSAPILLAPVAFQKMAHPDGELAAARAAARAGSIFVVSSTAVDFLEEVAAASDGPKWWQLYIFEDRAFTAEMLERAARAGFGAICWTVDFPVNGLRERDARNGFVLPIGLAGDRLVMDPALCWDDVAFIREHAPGLPLLVKGILTREDAEIAVKAGVDGIVVSNHGGRQLDSSPAGITVLPEIVEAVGGRIPVLVDGGIRRGTDVLKALALGASAVLVGRPYLWGLATSGEEGAFDVLRLLRDGFANAMALTGCRTVGEITPALVAPAG
ncbi:MAG: alpha-hydroxy-acid oxidizing protein [Actinobacteria bacterium]|nr:alpha-hydroxy-acid oxidizing protein [Actinomycetota bacterium]